MELVSHKIIHHRCHTMMSSALWNYNCTVSHSHTHLWILHRSLQCFALCSWVSGVRSSRVTVMSQSSPNEDATQAVDVWKLQKREKWAIMCLVAIGCMYRCSLRVKLYGMQPCTQVPGNEATKRVCPSSWISFAFYCGVHFLPAHNQTGFLISLVAT